MENLQIIQGDATLPQRANTNSTVYIPHCVNTVGAFGAGFVSAITTRWGETPRAAYKAWHLGMNTKEINDHLKERGFNNNGTVRTQTRFNLGGLQLFSLPNNIILANMIGQEGVGSHNGRPPIRYGAIAKAMYNLKEFIQNEHVDLQNCQIAAPRFGSGLAGGNQEVIQSLIQELWSDNGIFTTIYDFPNG